MTAAADPRDALSGRLGHAFQGLDLLREALTHRSFANEIAGSRDNERLALLGDAVLSLVVAERLLATAPERSRWAGAPRSRCSPPRSRRCSG